MEQDTGPRSLAAAWGLALGLGVLALSATMLGNAYLATRVEEFPRPGDLLFETLPYVRPARWLTVGALVVGFGAFLVDAVRHRPRSIPAAGCVFALMYLCRAVTMVLTPLAPAQGDGPFVFSEQQYGMFPSGHVGAVTLLVLLTPTERVGQRRLQVATAVLMVAGLLLARGHYSIDVVGGFLLAYAVATTWRSGRLFRRLSAVTGR
ncbi:hypothetical protein GCM10009584_01170 [Ornithinimicrobium humiphilum]|uniref:PAP2 superfamily protein n=1 Tax=Ornithinimicrobium humiphilum TaxID=125288 RepID=A0A543KRH4_9MICO|nr:phosphatase PAP2 family protein [Ornithinimicrobium humiphilum]TQM97683.1 PAP2 superfamily protein [Ornithinimicrobium humiphilum]